MQGISQNNKFTQNEALQNATLKALSEFYIKGENPHKIHKIYAHPSKTKTQEIHAHSNKSYDKPTTNAILKPAKIDYIIFLDSDDFWHKDLLKECVEAVNVANSRLANTKQKFSAPKGDEKNVAQSPASVDMVWVDYQPFFDGIKPFELYSWQELYQFKPKNSQGLDFKEKLSKDFSQKDSLKTTKNSTNSQEFATQDTLNSQNALKIITPQDFLAQASKTKQEFFAAAVQFFINFDFLKRCNLRFINGIIWEDVVWAENAITRASHTALLTKKLYNFRVRANSTSGYEGKPKKTLPPFVAPLTPHFKDSNEAWGYFSAFSWAVSLAEFNALCNEFSNTHNKTFTNEFKQVFAPFIIKNSLALFDFRHDPYLVKNKTARLFGRFAKQIWLEKELNKRLKLIALAKGNAFERAYYLILNLPHIPKLAYKWQKRVINGAIKAVKRTLKKV